VAKRVTRPSSSAKVNLTVSPDAGRRAITAPGLVLTQRLDDGLSAASHQKGNYARDGRPE
jgi:hypothetical protein